MGQVSPQEPGEDLMNTPLPLDMPWSPDPKLELPPTSDWLIEPPAAAFEMTALGPDGGASPVLLPPFLIQEEPTLLRGPISVPTPEPSSFVLVSAGIALFAILIGSCKCRSAPLERRMDNPFG